jgi:Ala-tRNA(Pro) deacylase
MLTRILALLDQRDVPYTHDVHPIAYTAREVAAADHIAESIMAKTIVVHANFGYAMTILPANRRVDLDALRDAFGTQTLRLATESELAELFPGCELGTMPPLGNGLLFEMPVYVDGRLAAEETIAFNAGTHRDVIRMPYKEFTRMVNPVVMEFAARAMA